MNFYNKLFSITMILLLQACGSSSETGETSLNCNSEKLLDPVIGAWSCTNQNNKQGELVFRENGRFSESGIDIFNGIATSWVNVTQKIYIITGNGADNVSIEFSDNNNMIVTPDKSFMDTVNCERSLCSQDANNQIIGSWSCINKNSVTGFLVFSENGQFVESGVDIFNGIASAWFHAGGDDYTITGNGSDSVNIVLSNNNNNITVTPEKSFMDTVTCTRN